MRVKTVVVPVVNNIRVGKTVRMRLGIIILQQERNGSVQKKTKEQSSQVGIMLVLGTNRRSEV